MFYWGGKNRSVSRSKRRAVSTLFLSLFFPLLVSPFDYLSFLECALGTSENAGEPVPRIFRRLLVPDFRPVFLHVAGCVGRAFRGAFRGSPFRICTNSYHLFASRMQDARIRLSAAVYAPRIDDSNGHISGKRFEILNACMWKSSPREKYFDQALYLI